MKGPRLPAALHIKLASVLLLLFLVAGIAYLSLVLWSTDRYHQEVTQRLNQNLAMYIADREALIQNGRVNQQAMAELGHLAMVINPIVEVYLLDTGGTILAHTLPRETVVKDRVELAPIKTLLEDDKPFPITGDDPRQAAGERVFSAYPVRDQGRLAGYLYILLGGQAYQSLNESLAASYILKMSLGGIIAIFLFAFSCLFIVFRLLTKPLRNLAGEMNRFYRDELRPVQTGLNSADEIQALRAAFVAMRDRIREQFERLRETDQVRRELISNVSHDLRTPLASMQGYLETLLVKNLPAPERRRYLNIAHRHCRRLTRLVAELFELSRLDMGRTSPHWETFSLAELLQDVLQKFQLAAERKNIRLGLETPEGRYPVYADIALIERVIENLIDNALRYTPPAGHIKLEVKRMRGQVRISVTDSGVGIDKADIPLIFDRYYCGQRADSKPSDHDGNGLGLAIVKRILELHGSHIEVRSKLKQGTSFSFALAEAF